MNLPELVREIATKVAHAAAKEAVATMVEPEFHAWLRDLGLDVPPTEAVLLWQQIAPLYVEPLVTVTFPELYVGVGDPTAVPAETESENGDTPA